METFQIDNAFRSRLERVAAIWDSQDTRNFINRLDSWEADNALVPKDMRGTWKLEFTWDIPHAVLYDGERKMQSLRFHTFAEALGITDDFECDAIPFRTALYQADTYTVEIGSSKELFAYAFNPLNYSEVFHISDRSYGPTTSESAQEYKRHCIDFFTKVLPCRVMVVKDSQNKIHGRALVFSDVLFQWEGSDDSFIRSKYGNLLTYLRIPTAGATVKKIMCNAAKAEGVDVLDNSVYEASSANDALLSSINPDFAPFAFAEYKTCSVPVTVDETYSGPAVFTGAFQVVYKGEFEEIYAGSRCPFDSDERIAYWGCGAWNNAQTPYCRVCGKPSDRTLCTSCAKDSGVVSTAFGEFATRDIKNLEIAPVVKQKEWFSKIFCKGDYDISYFE